MTSTDVLLDAYSRINEVVHQTVEGLSPEQLIFRPASAAGVANTIAWLVWHLTRVQDDHIADVAELEQVWTAKGWVERFGLPFDAAAHGYGHTADEVLAVAPASAELLTGYFDDVYAQTVAYLRTIDDADLARIIDTSWDPPVTLGVRLVSVIADDLQHAGQAAYLRGLLGK